ncbi:MAG: hypothetical protein R3F56_16745 [Planctomycetota bacterium]
MTTGEWNDRDVELLARLLAGECTPDAPEIAAELQAKPELRAEYEALAVVAEPMRRAGEQRRAAMTDALQRPIHEHERAMAATALRRAGLRTPPRRRWPGVAVAALVVVAVTMTLIWRRDPPGTPDRKEELLGSAVRYQLEPRGEVAEFTAFRWQDPAFEAGVVSYLVRVYAGDEGDPLLELPTDSQACAAPAGLPADLRWELIRIGADGQRRPLASTRVRQR